MEICELQSNTSSFEQFAIDQKINERVTLMKSLLEIMEIKKDLTIHYDSLRDQINTGPIKNENIFHLFANEYLSTKKQLEIVNSEITRLESQLNFVDKFSVVFADRSRL